jgi:hypothetical protein
MDEAPLLARKVLGSLRPANAACEEALAAVEANTVVRLRITKTSGNVRRNALYWAVLNVAAPNLSCVAPGINARLLHKVLKDRYGLVSVVTLPSGDQVKDYESTSFAKMDEPKRAEFVTWALATLASWLGCTPEELLNEGRAVAA